MGAEYVGQTLHTPEYLIRIKILFLFCGFDIDVDADFCAECEAEHAFAGGDTELVSIDGSGGTESCACSVEATKVLFAREDNFEDDWLGGFFDFEVAKNVHVDVFAFSFHFGDFDTCEGHFGVCFGIKEIFVFEVSIAFGTVCIDAIDVDDCANFGLFRFFCIKIDICRKFGESSCCFGEKVTNFEANA